MLFRSQSSQAGLGSSRVSRYPLSLRLSRTFSGAALSFSGPALSALPFWSALSSESIRTKPIVAGRASVFRNFLPTVASESAHKCAPLAMKIPRHIQARAGIRIGQGYCGHGVCSFRQWWIEGHLISTKVIFTVNAACLDGGEPAGAQHSDSMVLGTYCERSEEHTSEL